VIAVPSFVSGDHLVFFDPHCRFLPNTSPSHPGLKMKLSQSKLVDQFPDQFKPYMHFGSTCADRFEGTLFRFPLRNAEAAKLSEIKTKPCTPSEVLALLESFKSDAANALLFLKHVTKITIHSMDEEGGTTEVFSAVHTNIDPETQEQQSRIPRFVCGDAKNPMSKDDFYAQLQSTAESDLPISVYEKRIVVTDGREQDDSRWLISSAIGGGKARDLALSSVHGPYQLRLVPWAGVAARLSAPETDLVGRAYCFLPLPTMVGLPVHVNGSFELSANRRDIWQGSDMTGEGQLRS
jgi:sacsin